MRLFRCSTVQLPLLQGGLEIQVEVTIEMDFAETIKHPSRSMKNWCKKDTQNQLMANLKMLQRLFWKGCGVGVKARASY